MECSLARRKDGRAWARPESGTRNRPRGAKKNELKPHLKQQWVIPPKENAAFVCQMEDILDLYEQPYDENRPVVCFDERPCPLISEVKTMLPMKPGQKQKQDDQYERHGSANLFGFLEPLRGVHQMEVTQRRTGIDFAKQMQALVDVHYPQAELIRVVLDHLNTHKKASLYEAFPAQEAHRLCQKLEFHYTPLHGSWLNAIEMDFSALSKQCLDRRIGTIEELSHEVKAWIKERNEKSVKVDWQLTTEQARIKLKHLYPIFSS